MKLGTWLALSALFASSTALAGPSADTDLTPGFFSVPASLVNGSPVEVTVRVRNLGAGAGDGSLVITDAAGILSTVAAGCAGSGTTTITCALAPLSAGGSVIYTLLVSAGGAAGTVETLVASVVPTFGADPTANNTTRAFLRVGGVEDGANGVDDDADAAADCADSDCAADEACTDTCGLSYPFASGSNGFASGTGLFVAEAGRFAAGGSGNVPAGEYADALARTITIPSALSAARLEVVYRRIGSAAVGKDVFAVCLGDPACAAPGARRFETNVDSGSVARVAPDYFDGQFDHVFIDVSDLAGSTTILTLTYATNGSGGGGVMAIAGLRFVSDLDADGALEGSGPTCDACFDVDKDGYASETSPGGITCGPLDCDDTSGAISPGAFEICNAAGDEDCDGFENGFDIGSCGVEDCANDLDDNGDGLADCADPVCGPSLACDACAAGFSFNEGASLFVAADTKSGAGFTAGRLFQTTTRSDLGGAVGFGTSSAVSVAADHTTVPKAIVGTISRFVSVPSTLASPTLFVRYALDGEVAAGKDVFGVCFNVAPSVCTASASASVLAYKTDVDTGATLATVAIPFPAGVSGQTVNVVLMYDTVDSGNNANRGVFIDSVRIGSDVDKDGSYENTASATCDTCVDGDGDGFGATAVAQAFVAGCTSATPRDCDDGASNAKPGGPELCGTAGDQDCDGLVDVDDSDCATCGNGTQTGVEECDDGNPASGDGCSAACKLEAGALAVTEVHLTKFDPSAGGEQWVELQNVLTSPIDVKRAAVRLTNLAGQTVELASATYPAAVSTIAPGARLVVAFGPIATLDGLTGAATNPLGFELKASGDVLTVRSALSTVDALDLRGFACELGQSSASGKGRSLMLSVAPSAAANDSAANWCLAPVDASYANSGKHFGSPGALGTCAEATCDGVDDDCDGATDELLTDTDTDGTCDARDCAPAIATCASDCTTNVDGDALPDCRDGCVDVDGDGWGVKGGATTSTCKVLGGLPKADCDDTLSFVSPEAVETSAGGRCTNDLDDNCDGKRDCLDVACTTTPACAGESCGAAATLTCGQAVTVEPGSNDVACGLGLDAVFVFTPPTTGSITIDAENLGRTQYSVFLSKTTCSAIDCTGSVVPSIATTCAASGSRSFAVTQGQAVHLAVDGVADCAGTGAAAVRVTLRCAESCTDGTDDDGDGKTDCADADCVASAACATGDFDGDGATNAAEIACSLDPKNPGSVPSSDDVVDTDGDLSLNCDDDDDDGDGFTDSAELLACLDGAVAKNRDDIRPGAQPQCSGGLVDANCDKTYDTESAQCGSTELQCGDGLDDDADGKADCKDIDCVEVTLCAAADFDGDTVSNGVERQCGTSTTQPSSVPTATQRADQDLDGLASCIDLDDDGDGFPDTTEVLCGSNPVDSVSLPADLDTDGQCDASDPDDDGDGAPDVLETECGSDPRSAGQTPSQPQFDLDSDGVCDIRDPDRDGDTWTNAQEDACGTSLSDKTKSPTTLLLDIDGDRLCDALDDDDDGDGWSDDTEALCQSDSHDLSAVPPDLDLDGTCDLLDTDTDGDGWADALEAQCGTSASDPSDNPTSLSEDLDDDGLCNKVDSDDDGDGWNDLSEAQCGTDPASSKSKPVDTDADLVCDKNDDDDDGDGSLDAAEALCGTNPLVASSTPKDTDDDGLCDARDADADFDGDGWSNQAEGECTTDPASASSVPTDADADKLCDALETDDDADGWPDAVEVVCGTSVTNAASKPVDTDNDGQCNALDTDDDGDGSPDAAETLCGTSPTNGSVRPTVADLQDLDNDGLVGCVDTDDDGDLLSDAMEAVVQSDPLKPDTDGDGLTDGAEDKNKDGVVGAGETSPILADTDADGLSDGVEDSSCYIGGGASEACQPSSGTLADTDSDGLSDGVEDKNRDGKTSGSESNPLKKDTDGDGASDGDERRCQTDPLEALSMPVDKDQSGTCDGGEVDSDGDGIADGVELLCGTDALATTSVPSLDSLGDSDGDGALDCKDTDDDDDGALDTSELACGTGRLDKASTPAVAETVDTDTDGLLDCADPDDDGDGLVDSSEAALGGDPKDADTDDDGLSDGQEVKVLGTSPAVADSDGDGVQDGTEVGATKGSAFTGNGFVADSDPSTTTDPRNADTDDDSLSDGDEDENRNGRVDPGESDPLDPEDGRTDTDGDGLPDLVELEAGTNPVRVDTDGDGLSDKLEIDVWKTDPLVVDSDKGGVGDGTEVENGTIPTDVADDFAGAVVSGDNVFRCDVSKSGTASGGWAVALLLIVLAAFGLRRRRGVAPLVALVAALVGFGAVEARAQAVPNMNIENFWPAGGRYRTFSVEQSLVSPKWQPYGHIKVSGERQSLRLQTGTVEQQLIEFQTLLDVNLGIGLFDWLQLDVSLPVALQMRSADDVTAIRPVSGAGLGDLVVRLRGTIVPNRVGGFGMGASVGFTAPTGDGDHFRGDPGFGVLGNLIFDYRSERVALALNTGVRIRTSSVDFLGRTFGNELTYGLGLDVAAMIRHIDIGIELFGRTPLGDPFSSAKTSTLEVLAGPKWWIIDGLGLEIAAGAGLIQGYGAPDFRFEVGLMWAPAYDDSDGDGIADAKDGCPFNAEDPDAFADDDGCPELDNDNDNLLDNVDRCPLNPEDKNGIDDDDGCPDGDMDGDRIADGKDLCPSDREDLDGFEDEDGCPELDNDHDGIFDTVDKCPEDQETINGLEDRDGCPDVVTEKLAETVVQCRVALGLVYFEKAKDLLRDDARALLDDVAQTIANYQVNNDPPLLHVFVSGHASEEGTDQNNYDLSLRRALQVYDYLIAKGVSASLLERRGFGEARPLIDEETEEARTKNRRVQFEVELGGPCGKKKR